MADLYRITCEEVAPIEKLLKAIVEVNYYLESAWAEGWDIDLTINEDSNKVDVSISRSSSWPSPHDEEAQS